MNNSTNGGHFSKNIVYFVRTLRRAGIPIGPGQLLEALRAVEVIGLSVREDFYWTLHAVLVNCKPHHDLFDQLFHIFWRNPNLFDQTTSLSPSPLNNGKEAIEQDELSRRVSEAIAMGSESHDSNSGEDQLEYNASFTWSAEEKLQTKDFEDMSTKEILEAIAAIKKIHFPIETIPTRRYRSNSTGASVDMRSTVRDVLRKGTDTIFLKRRAKLRRKPPIVVLCDISGSMDRYARMMLHFLHALSNDRRSVHTFLFGTRLTNITQYLRNKDIDIALSNISHTVEDWSGGTRIANCLHAFNFLWSRRVLGQGEIVLLITDGLDRDSGTGLAEEMERLHRSCNRLIWLNPLLRYDLFEPKSLGIKAMIPHVDHLISVHNIESLKQLTEILAKGNYHPKISMDDWRKRAA